MPEDIDSEESVRNGRTWFDHGPAHRSGYMSPSINMESSKASHDGHCIARLAFSQEMATICAARHGPPEPDHVQRPNVSLRATLASRHIADPAVQLLPAVSVLAGRTCIFAKSRACHRGPCIV